MLEVIQGSFRAVTIIGASGGEFTGLLLRRLNQATMIKTRSCIAWYMSLLC